MGEVVGIHPGNPIGLTLLKPHIGCFGNALVINSNDAESRIGKLIQDMIGIVCRTIVDNDEFQIGVGLLQNGIDRPGDGGRGIENGKEDGNSRHLVCKRT